MPTTTEQEIPTSPIQKLVAELCDADNAIVTHHWDRRTAEVHCTVAEIQEAVEKDYYDRWAAGVRYLMTG